MQITVDAFIPVLAGYLFLRHCAVTRYEVLRESGHHVAFRSALVGLLFYLAGWTIAVLWPPPSNPFGQILAKVEEQLGVTAGGILTLALSYAASTATNLVARRRRRGAVPWNTEAAVNREDSVVKLLYEALAGAHAIEVSLAGDKTYVGWVVETPSADHDKTFQLVPLFSGYRNDRQQLVLSESYATLLASHLRAGRDLRDLRIVVPRSSIRWVRFFDVALYSVPEGEQPPRPVRTEEPLH